MKRGMTILWTVVLALFVAVAHAWGGEESTRKERHNITAGNKLYNEGKYRAAMLKYQDALKENPSSAVGR